MAERKIWWVTDEGVRELIVGFKWHGIMTPQHKLDNVTELHLNTRQRIRSKFDLPINPIEISTTSPWELGRDLSAFNLKVNGVPVEVLYQKAKVFKDGTRLALPENCDSKTAKRIAKENRKEIAYMERSYSDLYFTGVYEYFDKDLKKAYNALKEYDVFTDVWFNHTQSRNCQAKYLALMVSNLRRKYR